MGHNHVVSGNPKSTGIPQVDGLSTGPRDLGCHTTNLKCYKLMIFLNLISFVTIQYLIHMFNAHIKHNLLTNVTNLLSSST